MSRKIDLSIRDNIEITSERKEKETKFFSTNQNRKHKTNNVKLGKDFIINSGC